MKLRLIAAIAAVSVCLSGCGNNADVGVIDAADNPVSIKLEQAEPSESTELVTEPPTENNLYAIEGIAMPCTNGIIFILSDHNGGYTELTPISMSAADNDDSIFDGLAAGDKIKAETALIEESYPAHTYVYSLEKTGSGSIDDIPADLLARLEEMGYTAEENAPSAAAEENTVHTELCMIDGVVYYNTGETNNVPRCGTPDGMFDEVIAEGEFPEKDGQANFSAYGFQWGMEAHTIEVCIDDNWYIFKPLDDPAVNEPIPETEAAGNSDEIKTDEITPLSRDEDLQIRTDYAAYVSASSKGTSGRLASADDVYGKFYFGTFDGYMIVVMCPSECYTDDIGVHRLRCTDADIIDPSCDCYPYIDVELPSGMFELLAYKDNTFITVEKALEEGYIDYSAAKIIGDYMEAYYMGNRQCVYNISCWR